MAAIRLQAAGAGQGSGQNNPFCLPSTPTSPLFTHSSVAQLLC